MFHDLFQLGPDGVYRGLCLSLTAPDLCRHLILADRCLDLDEILPGDES
jgi:hypothetical protein